MPLRLLAWTALLLVGAVDAGAALGRGLRLAATQSRYSTKLRVCNAYPYSTPLSVALGSEKLTDQPMAYKDCRDFDVGLVPKDQVIFSFGDARAGTFVVNDLPRHDAVLLLVIYRHDVETTAVAFESHVFTNLLNSQIAVMDTYRGPQQSSIRIEDGADASTDRSEPLGYDQVAAVDAGSYEVVLMNADGELKARAELVAQNRESYVAIRCGVQPRDGRSYPEEIFVYPGPTPETQEPKASAEPAEKSSAERAAALGLASLFACALM